MNFFIRKEKGRKEEGETLINAQKYDLSQVEQKIVSIIQSVLFQHKEAKEIVIEKAGVFKKEKGMRNREKIRSFGDEKEMLEGDFYKPEKPASPFFSCESSLTKIENKTGSII